jgi:hypothetical protein
LLLLTSSASAGTTILQFSQVNPNDAITATESGGVTTVSTAGYVDGGFTSIPVVLTNFNGQFEPPGTIVFETFVGVTSTNAASLGSNGQTTQDFSGTIKFTALPESAGYGTNYLTATFTKAVFSGAMYASTMNVSAPTLTFTSSYISDFIHTGMALSFSNVSPIVQITGSSLGSFTAQNTGTFSALAVPEPSTLCLSLVSVVIGATAARVRKAMKREKAEPEK